MVEVKGRRERKYEERMTGRREEIERGDRREVEDEKEKREKSETGRVERMQISSGGNEKMDVYFIERHSWVFKLQSFPRAALGFYFLPNETMSIQAYLLRFGGRGHQLAVSNQHPLLVAELLFRQYQSLVFLALHSWLSVNTKTRSYHVRKRKDSRREFLHIR